MALSACAVLSASIGLASPEQDAQVKPLWAECEARDADTAIEGCTKIVAQNLENKEDAARAYHARGKAYKTRGNYNAAIEDFGQAIGLSPGYADAYVQRGWCYYNGNADAPHALADYNKAIKLQPDFAEAFIHRGNIHQLEGDRAQAKPISILPSRLLTPRSRKTPHRPSF